MIKLQVVKLKQIKATHENTKIYCHIYNNDIDCPFEYKSIFLHEESEKCKYGRICERLLCMYTHDDASDEKSDEDDDVDEKEESEKEEEESEN